MVDWFEGDPMDEAVSSDPNQHGPRRGVGLRLQVELADHDGHDHLKGFVCGRWCCVVIVKSQRTIHSIINHPPRTRAV